MAPVRHRCTPAQLCGHRRSIRLEGWDYAGRGTYFITIGTYHHRRFLARIHQGVVMPMSAGRVVLETWTWLAEHFRGVRLDAFVLMPNHIHSILDLRGTDVPLGRIVGAFKSRSAAGMRRRRLVGPIWERDYYERIVRDANALHAIRAYIARNPACWRG